MTVVVEVGLPADAFALGQLVTGHPDVWVELERVVPTADAAMPFVWVVGDDLEFVRTASIETPAVEDITVLDDIGDRLLCRVSWNAAANGFCDLLADSDATVLDARGSSEEWVFRLRFVDRDETSRFSARCDDRDIPVEIRRVYALDELPAKQYDLTHEQREALLAAFDAGYFKVPRQSSLSELADDLDISPQATSGRLRRGLDRVLATVLFPPGEPDADEG